MSLSYFRQALLLCACYIFHVTVQFSRTSLFPIQATHEFSLQNVSLHTLQYMHIHTYVHTYNLVLTYQYVHVCVLTYSRVANTVIVPIGTYSSYPWVRLISYWVRVISYRARTYYQLPGCCSTSYQLPHIKPTNKNWFSHFFVCSRLSAFKSQWHLSC